MFHPKWETPSGVDEAVKVRLDNDLPHQSVSGSQHGVAHCNEEAYGDVQARRVQSVRQGCQELHRKAPHVLLPLISGALTTITAQCLECLGVTGDFLVLLVCDGTRESLCRSRLYAESVTCDLETFMVLDSDRGRSSRCQRSRTCGVFL